MLGIPRAAGRRRDDRSPGSIVQRRLRRDSGRPLTLPPRIGRARSRISRRYARDSRDRREETNANRRSRQERDPKARRHHRCRSIRAEPFDRPARQCARSSARSPRRSLDSRDNGPESESCIAPVRHAVSSLLLIPLLRVPSESLPVIPSTAKELSLRDPVQKASPVFPTPTRTCRAPRI